MKKSELIFNVILVPVDFVVIILAVSVAYFLRFETVLKEFRPVIDKINFLDFIILTSIFTVLCILIFAFLGLYNLRVVKKFDEFYKIFIGISAAFVLAIVLIFLNKELFSSRFIILSAWILCVLFVFVARLIIGIIRRSIFKKGVGVYREIIIGNNRSEIISNEMKNSPGLGFKVIKKIGISEGNVNIDEILKELKKFKERDLFDEVILSDPTLPRRQILKLAGFCDDNNIIFKFVPDILGTHILNYDIRTIGGIPIIELTKTSLEGWGKVAKKNH